MDGNCQGTINKKRKLQNRTEQAILDFILANKKMSSQ